MTERTDEEHQEPYPDDISTGYPADDEEIEPVVNKTDPEYWKEPYPSDEE